VHRARFEDTIEVDVLMSTAYAAWRAGDSSKALATILAPRRIRVNVVVPGQVSIPLIATTTDPDKLEQFGADSAFGAPRSGSSSPVRSSTWRPPRHRP
jgi:NAD(P)-dependent dehydrogenase (short-subunit alcohol dehydrogenase family)